jgi:dUTP pyrophosphatase
VDTQGLTVKIKVHHPWCKPVKNATGDWIDLCIAEDIYSGYNPPYYKSISLGVSMKLPDGYEAIVASRSSTYK